MLDRGHIRCAQLEGINSTISCRANERNDSGGEAVIARTRRKAVELVQLPHLLSHLARGRGNRAGLQNLT